MEIYTTDTIRDIGEREWHTLVGHDNIEQSYAWMKMVEESGARKVYYVFLKDRKLEAAACCTFFREKMFSVELPFLEVKSPLGLSPAFFSRTPQHADMLLKELRDIQKKEKTKVLSILCLKKDEVDFIRTQVGGFVEFPMNDNTYIDLDFADFEDYLSWLPAKARRSVRITLNKAKKLGVTSLSTNEFSKWKSTAHRLQKNICQQYKDYQWLLPEQFYDSVERNFKEHAELLMFFKDDIPLAFGFSVNTPDIVKYKFVGADPQYRDYQAYFLIYYEGIKKAIERGQKRITFGLTSYSFKEKIGCTREKLFGLFQMRNPGLNLALQSYSKVMELYRRISSDTGVS
jgi:predicted N-acyltransferase